MFFLSLLLCHIKAVGWDILSAVKALWTGCLEAWYARYIYMCMLWWGGGVDVAVYAVADDIHALVGPINITLRGKTNIN